MTRSRCRSNRLKRNKTKRYRQTKNKRRRQHGGTVKKYQYTPDSVNILKPEQVTDPVLIPGYSEIMDMMQEYEDPRGSNGLPIDQSKKLNDGIKKIDVQLLYDCSLSQTKMLEGKIIVVRKEDKNFFTENTSIECTCTSDQYYALASHNFRIFIRDILKWNPFLNLPQHKKKQEEKGWQGYQPRMYSGEFKPKSTDSNDYWNLWWNSQLWWTGCKETLESAGQQSSSQPSSTPQPPQSVDLSLILRRPPPLNTQLISVTGLIDNNLKNAISSLQELIQNSREKHKYRNITSKIEELISSVQTLSHITPQINQLLTTQQQSS